MFCGCLVVGVRGAVTTDNHVHPGLAVFIGLSSKALRGQYVSQTDPWTFEDRKSGGSSPSSMGNQACISPLLFPGRKGPVFARSPTASFKRASAFIVIQSLLPANIHKIIRASFLEFKYLIMPSLFSKVTGAIFGLKHKSPIIRIDQGVKEFDKKQEVKMCSKEN